MDVKEETKLTLQRSDTSVTTVKSEKAGPMAKRSNYFSVLEDGPLGFQYIKYYKKRTPNSNSDDLQFFTRDNRVDNEDGKSKFEENELYQWNSEWRKILDLEQKSWHEVIC